MPAPLNNFFNLFFQCNFRDQITYIMLSRVTVIVYACVVIIFLLDCVINYYELIVTEANTFLSYLAGEQPITTICFSIMSLIIVYVLVNLVFVYIKATFLKLRSGKPPFGRLIIAYKFIQQDAWNMEGVFSRTRQLFPNKKLIQLYYKGFQISGDMGVAYGVILSEIGALPDDDMRHFLFKNGFRLFFTPAIDNAVHITCPVISWLMAPTYYIALRSLYPKLLRYCERLSLCAYPVIEVFQKDEITLLAPLARQDDFIVEEAEGLFTHVIEDTIVNNERKYFHSSSVSNLSISAA